jgi:3-hydroxyisobutyrate dehydrogenase
MIMDQRVALLGLGTMGQGMAANLLKAGFGLTVYNRTPAKAQEFAGQGARAAATPAEAVRGAQVILTMVTDDAASREVWLGSDGALAAADGSAVLVESSTVSPEWVAELAAAAGRRGLRFLDAPVTGSRVQAAGGQLSFLVGGDEATLEAARPALSAMSKEIVHVGGTGSGAKLKLINNFLCGVQVASLAEGITWIERAGLDRAKALKFLTGAAPGSPLIGGVSARMASHEYEVNFLLRLMQKDLGYAHQEAAREGVRLTTAEVARARFEQASAAGFGEQDMSAVVELVRSKG